MRRATVTHSSTLNFNSPLFSSSLRISIPLLKPASSSPRSRFISNPNLSSPSQDPLWAFINLLKSISKSSASPLEVENLHSKAIKAGFIIIRQVYNGLLNLYAKCCSLDLAQNLFDEMTERDALSWTVLISGYSRISKHEIGLRLFSQMITGGVLPNCFTLASTLKCCMSLGDLGGGKGIHGWMIRKGVEPDLVLENTVVDFYAKCGAFEYAKKVFGKMGERDTISWNTMIGAHLGKGDTNGAMELFRASPHRDASSWNTVINGQMQNGSDLVALKLLYEMINIGIHFSQFTLSMALTLVGSLALLELGRQMHGHILRIYYEEDAFIRNSLIDMYSKCGKIDISMTIFNKAPQSTSITKSIQWSSMIAGFVQNGRGEEALKLFSRMLQEGIKVDQFTLTSISSACSNGGILEQGWQVHACIEKSGHGYDSFLTSAMIDMYAKCGSLEDARKSFDTANCRNVVMWTSIIGSCASHGHGREAIQLFEQMLEEKIIPNEVTFVGVLSACSHGGLVKEGYKYFRMMLEVYGITPSIEHFTCMVDLLGRAGLLEEAKDFVDQNKISHHGVVWRALLSACRVHNNVEMATWVSEQLFRVEPQDVGSYVLLSNSYAINKRFVDSNRLRRKMSDRGMSKEPGCSWIQIKDKFHVFTVGDRSHPQAEDIHTYLERLLGRLKELGYQSRSDLVLQDLEEEQRDSALSLHSEKLAVAYGIISTPGGMPLRVMKNLRVCGDCHEAIKYISQATSRKIVLRDAHLFHHFENGKCSCGDYW